MRVTEFENDIFISYAHLDNLPLTDDQPGWITAFHAALASFIGQYLGKSPKIWRDRKLTGNDKFDQEIMAALRKVAVLVSILSPRYVESEWCRREIQTFYELAQELEQQTGNGQSTQKSRVFKVVKFPVPPERQWPEELRSLLGYEFYQKDLAADRPREVRPEFGGAAREQYLLKVSDLAYDIKNMLESLQTEASKPTVEASTETSTPPSTKTAGKTVYLAETTFDLNQQRDNIKRELLQRGCTVLPNQPLQYGPNFQTEVCGYLPQCQLSIHLIGARYGIVPEAAENSGVDLQYQLATAQSQANSNFSRLVWLPIGLQAEEPRQEAFIQLLQNDIELLQTNLEELKTIIRDQLTPQASPSPSETTVVGPVRVYLVCDPLDAAAVRPLDDYLYEQGFEVILPLFDGDEAEVRQEHQENLCVCDAVLIYWGDAKESWLRAKLQDLRKLAGYGRCQPLPATAIYLGSAETPVKQRFRTREAQVIKQFGAFAPNGLASFVARIAGGRD
ncbi:MAG: toll/interleukin-1 receptor domain-containing protein [Cyanothece sp. SIO1E1]|nr:toll/interleukin-1 receptor domain-containing protein [Cyanothece sp. SIO1E1]